MSIHIINLGLSYEQQFSPLSVNVFLGVKIKLHHNIVQDSPRKFCSLPLVLESRNSILNYFRQNMLSCPSAVCYKTDGLHLYGCLPGIAHLPQQLVQVWNVRPSGRVVGGRWPFNFHAFWIALILVCCFTLNFIPSTPQLSSVLGMMFVVSLEDCRHVAWIQTHIVTQGKTYHHHPKYLELSPSWVGKKTFTLMKLHPLSEWLISL